jgi:hypothetical protein
MFKKLTTAFGLALIFSSLAFAAPALSTNSKQAATKPAAVQVAPSGSQQHHATTSKSAKKHKRHQKKNAGSTATSKSATPKQ